MTCAGIRAHFSRLRDAELPSTWETQVHAHLGSCRECDARWQQWSAVLDGLAGLPSPPVVDLVTPVRERLALQRRDPGLASLFRPLALSRPLLAPSLVTALLLWLSVAVPVLLRFEQPLPRPHVAYSQLADWGRPAEPLVAGGSVTPPRQRATGLAAAALSEMGEGSLFLETVVARSGRVSRVRLLGGDVRAPAALLDALARQRFDPGSYRGELVPVAVYRLISRLEVRPALL